MSDIRITSATREAATQEALNQLRLPLEALDIEWSEEEPDDLLAGARPLVQMNVKVRLEYVAQVVVECTRNLLEKMEIRGEVEAHCDDDFVLASISCDHQETLIGHRGETLDALQHLVVRMTNMGGRDMPLIIVDAGNYRKRRIERLKRVARDLAHLALQNGTEEVFDPMDAIDRKIVHTVLKGIEGVKTYSRGEEENRHVIVAPDK
jgi:spoIIIJ-associated protein